MCSITGGGERLHNVLRQIGSKLLVSMTSPHWLIKGKMVYPPFLGCFWSDPFILAVTRTCIKSCTSSNFGQIGPLTTELAALERLKKSHRLSMGKWCPHARSFIFDRIIIKVAGNQDRHKSSVEFDFGLNQTINFGVICPSVTKISHFWTWISLKLVGQSWFNLMCSIIGMGERLHKVLGQIWSKLLFPWQQKAPLIYKGKMMSPSLLGCFLIRSFLYLQVTWTCIKSRKSSNFG